MKNENGPTTEAHLRIPVIHETLLRVEIITRTGNNPDGTPQGTKTGEQYQISQEMLDQMETDPATLMRLLAPLAHRVTKAHSDNLNAQAQMGTTRNNPTNTKENNGK